MVVNAAYTNGAALEITGYTYSPQVLTDGVTAVTVSYAEGRTVKTASQPVTVTPVLAGLEVRVQPDKTAYRYLETFDPAGMEADAVYSTGRGRRSRGIRTLRRRLPRWGRRRSRSAIARTAGR